jgi:hypothetical protein
LEDLPMRADTKRTRTRRPARRAKRQPGREPGTAAQPSSEEAGRPFDEPATAPPKLNISVEEPVARDPVVEEEDACGSPDAARTPASDLH